MHLKYDFKPYLMKRIWYIEHKEKRTFYESNKHVHGENSHEIIYVDYGKIELFIDDMKSIVHSGECFFIPGCHNHSFKGADNNIFDFLNIGFKGQLPDSLFCKSIPIDRFCASLFAKIKYENEMQVEYYKENSACYLTELLIYILRQVNNLIPAQSISPSALISYKSDFVNKAIALITEKYSDKLTFSQLCKALNVSTPHMSALLKKETGKNFMQILHEHRIAAAKHLLRNSSNPVQNVAWSVGYSSLPFFFRMFKRLTGKTPGAYIRGLKDN